MLKNCFKSKWWMLLILPAWVFISFSAAQFLIEGLVLALSAFHVPLESFNRTILSTILAIFVYVITIALVIGAPWLIKKRRTSRTDIGLTRLPSWTDILMTPVGLIAYLVLSVILILLATKLLPWFNINQVQDTGFNHLNGRYEYILAFTTLVVIAPVAEEVLFRGYLYGKLKKFVPIWVAIIVTSLLFGAIHGAWNLAFDTFALSIVLCLLRELTGSLWVSILLHMTKNGIAFYILFINTALLTTLGG